MTLPTASSLYVGSGKLRPSDFRLVERFQTLEPGHYWRRKAVSKRGLPQGVVLLLLDVIEFDGKPHTVKLATHPLEGGDGRHEFLVGEFLEDWEYAPDGAEVRERELHQLQTEIAAANTELLEGQVNPALVAPAIQKDLAAWESKRAEEARRAASESGEAPAALVNPTARFALMVRGGQVRTDLGFVAEHRLTQDDVSAIRVTVEREAVIAESKVRWLTARTDAIASKVRAMTPFFKEKAAVALAQTSHVRKFTDDLMKGLASLDLYTGKNVEVVTIKEGPSAPADELLTLMQRKLFIEEELAVWADLDADFDYSSIELFDEHIAKSPALLQQICPTPRCVVAVAMRRCNVDYENIDPQEWMRRNRENKAVFLLVRNGEKPLPSLEEKKAFDTILSLAHSLRRTDTDFADMVEAYAVEHKLRPLRAVLTGKNRLALYVEVPAAERNEDIMEWRWVRRLSISMKPKLHETSRKFVWLTEKCDANEVEIKSWPELDGWINVYPEPFRVDYLLSVVNMVERGMPTMSEMFKGAGQGVDEEAFSLMHREFKHRLWDSKSKTVPSVTISVPIAAYAKYSLRNRDTGERQVESLRVVAVRALACEWLHHFGDPAQRESTERTFVGIHKNKEHARKTLALPFDPGLDSVDGRSIDSIVAFDAAWIEDDSIRVAQSYVREPKPGSSFATLTRVERSIDEALTFWMNDVRPEGAQGNSYRPEKVLVNPAAWDGEIARLIAALDLQTKDPA